MQMVSVMERSLENNNLTFNDNVIERRFCRAGGNGSLTLQLKYDDRGQQSDLQSSQKKHPTHGDFLFWWQLQLPNLNDT